MRAKRKGEWVVVYTKCIFQFLSFLRFLQVAWFGVKSRGAWHGKSG